MKCDIEVQGAKFHIYLTATRETPHNGNVVAPDFQWDEAIAAYVLMTDREVSSRETALDLVVMDEHVVAEAVKQHFQSKYLKTDFAISSVRSINMDDWTVKLHHPNDNWLRGLPDYVKC